MLQEKIKNVLSLELDEITLKKAMTFIDSELSSESIKARLEEIEGTFSKSKLKELNLEIYSQIVSLILLGMGRNRTIKILEEHNVTRTNFEKVRYEANLCKEDWIENEKKITNLKWEVKARKNRLAELNKVDWNEIKSKYEKGASPLRLGKDYKVSQYFIIEQLKEEGLFDEKRSSITRKKEADEKFSTINDNFIIELVNQNPLDSKELLWRKAQKTYPWLLRRQMYKKMDDLNLTRTDEEVREIKAIKAKTETNADYMIKVNGYKAAREVFGSIENLVKLYVIGTLGSFNKIADKINSSIDFDYEISARQVSKIITSHESYVRKMSLGQAQLLSFIKKIFAEEEVLEEYSWDPNNPNKKIDIYIPALKVGLEYNGDYWHSDAVIKYNYGISANNFHKARAEELSKANIKLVFVWEEDWNTNYKEVENAIKNKDWDSKILNKYENQSGRSGGYSAPSKNTSLLRQQTIRFLKENNISHNKGNKFNLIKLIDYDIIINIPNKTTLASPKETLNLQKHYEEQGIELLTFLPWRDITKVKDFLSYRLGLAKVERIPARKCKFEIVDKLTKEHRAFFEENHLLGYNNFKNIHKLAMLTKDDELLMAALFTKDKRGVELKRLASLGTIAIQGGASKLLKNYIKETGEKNIFTFSDCDLGFGSIYKKLGFNLVERSKEQLTWYNEDIDMKVSNVSLVQIGTDRLLRKLLNYEEVGIGKDKPNNQEIIQSYGFIPIYDSGYKKWVLEEE